MKKLNQEHIFYTAETQVKVPPSHHHTQSKDSVGLN